MTKSTRKSIYITLALLCVLALGVGVFFACCGVYRVSGQSMLPSLSDHQLILVDKTNKSPALGDIVVYHSPESGNLVVKRVVAAGGDRLTLECEENGYFLSNNGKRICELSVEQYYFLNALLSTQPIVPDNMVFCMGDNRDISRDSRNYGFINKESIIGVLL